MPKTTEAPTDTVVVEVTEIDPPKTTKVAMLKNLAKNPRILAVAIAVTSSVVVIALNSRKNEDEEQTAEA
jgi:predicted permease